MAEKITCPICKQTPSQQKANNVMSGNHCSPGRCIVHGTVWRTFLDGEPVDFEWNSWEKVIHQNYVDRFEKNE